MERDSKGRFLPGQSMGEDLKKRIGEGQQARYRRQASQQGPRPDRKRCTKCKQVKRVPEDYVMRKRQLKCGETYYPSGECKACMAERSAAYRQVLREDPQVARETYRRWNANRNPERRNRYQREYQRIQRRLDGTPERGPWRRYRDEAGGKDVRVDRKPFDDYLTNLRMGASELADLTGLDEGVFRTGRTKGINLSTVDLVFTRLGDPDQVAVLYGHVIPRV